MKKKKMLYIIIILIITLVTYLFFAIVPNIFLPKGINMNDERAPHIVAHRGGANLGAENTLDCIERGMQTRASMIEIDVHQTKDNQLVVCHDETVDRTTNGHGYIRELTLNEIKQMKIVDNDGNVTQQHIPTLDEVLKLVNGKVQLLIEIKRTENIYQGIEQRVLTTLQHYNAIPWCVIQSFNDSVLFTIHNLDPSIRLEKLYFFKLPGLPIIYDGSFTSFSFEKYSFIKSFNSFYLSLTPSLISNMQQHGYQTKIWTLQGPTSVPQLDVNAIITDAPSQY